MISLLMVIATAVSADNHASKLLPQYSFRFVAEQTNPWALPQTSEEYLDLQQPTRFRQRPNRPGQYQMGRFVTPQILESLKQQQMQTQMMPESRQNNQLKQRQLPSKQSFPQQSWSTSPGQGYYGSPSYGMGYADPLYDTPAVSPWGSGPDGIYRGGLLPGSLPGGFGDSIPWVPNEAIGGIPPIHIPSLGDNSFGSQNYGGSSNTDTGYKGTNNSERRVEDNVFNPFTFIPNRRWQ